MFVVVKWLSCVRLFVTPWIAACQASLSMGFSRQEYWSGLPFSSPGDLPEPGIEPTSPALAGGFFTAEPPGKRWKTAWPSINHHHAQLHLTLYNPMDCNPPITVIRSYNCIERREK